MPIGLSPFYFARIPLHFKVLVAFGSTESKNLQEEWLSGNYAKHKRKCEGKLSP